MVKTHQSQLKLNLKQFNTCLLEILRKSPFNMSSYFCGIFAKYSEYKMQNIQRLQNGYLKSDCYYLKLLLFETVSKLENKGT